MAVGGTSVGVGGSGVAVGGSVVGGASVGGTGVDGRLAAGELSGSNAVALLLGVEVGSGLDADRCSVEVFAFAPCPDCAIAASATCGDSLRGCSRGSSLAITAKTMITNGAVSAHFTF